MKAPNKLFIKPGQIKVEMIPGGELPNVGIQYIRKDALMEWAEKELDRLYELIPDASNENPSQMELRYLGQYMQTEILIDKLNSP